jgi:hypothetical protein
MVICGSSRVADPDWHDEPCLAQGSHRRAVREPAAGRKPRIPGADDGGPRNPGSQSREPMPADSPRTLRDGPGRICRRRLPARLPQTGPDTRFVPGGPRGHGLNHKVCRPSRKRSSRRHSSRLISSRRRCRRCSARLTGPAPPRACGIMLLVPVGAACLAELCAAWAGAGRVAAQPSAAAVTGSSIRSGSPCRARERRASSAPARRNAWRSSLLSGRPAGRLLPFVRAVTLPAPRPGC